MTCAEFQKVLPYIIETGGAPKQEEHLRNCQVCADLVADLKYIAEQAKLLVPMEEPSPRVWAAIRSSLEREGAGRRGLLHRGLQALFSRKFSLWVGAAAVIVLLGVAGLLYRRPDNPAAVAPLGIQGSAEQSPLALAASDPDSADDQQLLVQIEQRRPEMRAAYETTFSQVNQSIADARKSIQLDPDDEDATQAFIRACQQKVMLYDMALRSLQ